MRIDLSRVEPWPGSLCCARGKDTTLSQCLCDELASHPGCVSALGSRNTTSHLMIKKENGISSGAYMGHFNFTRTESLSLS